MKALSVKQPWASLIADGTKTIETRTWQTNYRGPLLIISSKKPTGQGPVGVAMALVKLKNCRAMQLWDEPAACCEIYPNAIAWDIELICKIESEFPMKGQLGLFEVHPDEFRELADYEFKHGPLSASSYNKLIDTWNNQNTNQRYNS